MLPGPCSCSPALIQPCVPLVCVFSHLFALTWPPSHCLCSYRRYSCSTVICAPQTSFVLPCLPLCPAPIPTPIWAPITPTADAAAVAAVQLHLPLPSLLPYIHVPSCPATDAADAAAASPNATTTATSHTCTVISTNNIHHLVWTFSFCVWIAVLLEWTHLDLHWMFVWNVDSSQNQTTTCHSCSSGKGWSYSGSWFQFLVWLWTCFMPCRKMFWGMKQHPPFHACQHTVPWGHFLSISSSIFHLLHCWQIGSLV